MRTNKKLPPNRRFTLSLIISALALVQSLQAFSAETNHNFARWEKEIGAFEQTDRTNPPPKKAVLFIGSSTIRFWTNLPADFPKQRTINRGFGGSQIVDATYFADRIIFPYKPKVIFLRSGGNDLWAGKTPEEVFGDYQAFVKTVKSKLPRTKIVFISLSPSIARWKQADKEKAVNDLVKEYAHKHSGLSYLETYSLPLGVDGQPRPELFREDKLHFNAEGYKLLAERVRTVLK